MFPHFSLDPSVNSTGATNMQLTITEALPLIRIFLACNKAIMLHGAPGIGKSQLVAQLAKEAGARLIDIRLSYFDPVDLRGIPFVHEGKTLWACPSIWPTDNGELVYLFFDELTSCPPALQAAAYQAILEKRIGEISFGDNVKILAAGNGQEHKAIAFKLSSALANRMGHIDLIPDAPSLVAHFAKIGIRPDVIALLSMPRDPGNEIIFNMGADSRTFPSPRAWESVSILVNEAEAQGAPDSMMKPLVASLVGEGAASEYCGMRRVFHSLPRIADVVASPATAKLPQEPDSVFAITAALARIADRSNMDSIVHYLGRLPMDSGGIEFSARAMAQIVARAPELKETRGFIDWAIANQDIAL
jgi:hypothetical protein